MMILLICNGKMYEMKQKKSKLWTRTGILILRHTQKNTLLI